MTVKNLIDELGLSVYNPVNLEREITGGYCGDLLSFVMGSAPCGCAWVTIMGGVNTIAVALLADTACVILAESVQPGEEAEKRAKEQDICLLGSKLDSFELCGRIYALLNKNNE